jgi:hypothetical protein
VGDRGTDGQPDGADHGRVEFDWPEFDTPAEQTWAEGTVGGSNGAVVDGAAAVREVLEAPPQGAEATLADLEAVVAAAETERKLQQLFEAGGAERVEWLRRALAAEPARVMSSTLGAYARLKGQELAKDLIRAEDTSEEELFARLLAATYDRATLDDIPRPAQLIDGVLLEGGYTVLSGMSQSMKSFTAIDWMMCLATGAPWLDRHEVARTGPTLYVAAEGAGGIQERLRAWEAVHHDGQQVKPEMIRLTTRAVDIGNPQQVRALARLSRDVGAALVVLDTLKRCTPGLDENSNSEMSQAMNGACDAIREACGAATLFIHHTGHAGARSRGASAIEDDADVVWHMVRDPDTDVRKLRQAKSKDAQKVEELSVRFMPVDGTRSGVLTPVLAGGVMEFINAATAMGGRTINDVARFRIGGARVPTRPEVEAARGWVKREVDHGRLLTTKGDDNITRVLSVPAAMVEVRTAPAPGSIHQDDGLFQL